MQGFPAFCGVREVLSQNGVLAGAEMFPTAEARRGNNKYARNAGTERKLFNDDDQTPFLLSWLPAKKMPAPRLRVSAVQSIFGGILRISVFGRTDWILAGIGSK
jgi:hypothetical protein